jgi:hypothetical protein
VLFSDEKHFYVNEEVNKQNFRCWSKDDPLLFFESKQQGSEKLVQWCDIWDSKVIGTFSSTGTVTGKLHFRMIRDKIMPKPYIPDDKPAWFMQDVAPPYCALAVGH